MLNTNYTSDFAGIYDDAFSADFTALWYGTPFKNEISDLSYNRAATCFIQNNELAEVDRRKILYYYLANIFNTETGRPLDRSKPILKTDNLLVNRVINNICSLYNDEPSRRYTVNNKDWANDDFNKILKKSNINRALKQAYKLSKLCNEVAIRPYVNSKNELKFQILTPDLYRTLKNDLGEVIEFWVPFQTYDNWGDITERFHVWDAQKYVRKDLENRLVKFTHLNKEYGKEGYNHNYGRIPYAILKLNDNEIYNGGLWELVLTQIYCNAIDHIANENLLYGGIGLWYLQNFDLKGQGITLNPGDALVAENVGASELEPPRVEFVQGAPIYNEIQVFKEFIIKNTLKSMGMPSGMLSDNPGLQSGISMKIDRMELNEYRKDDIDILQAFEEELINLFIVVSNTDLKTNYPELEIYTDYQEQSIYLEPKDELDYVQALYDKGLITPLEYLTRLTGNSLIKTNEDAIKFINTNKEYNGTVTNEFDTSSGTSGTDEPIQPETEDQPIKETIDGRANKEPTVRTTN